MKGSGPSVKVGDVVILKDDNVKRICDRPLENRSYLHVKFEQILSF